MANNGGRAKHSKGYILVKVGEDHPRGGVRRYVAEHTLVMEKHLSRYLVDGECVHHIDGDKTNNNILNLVLCKNNSEHKKIHLEQRAFLESGHKNWRMCKICKKWDSPDNLYINGKNIRHRECWREYYRDNRDKFNRWQRDRRRKAAHETAVDVNSRE